MNILVPIKRVIDYNVKVRVKSDGSGVDAAGVKMSMNPFDEVAVEQAVRLREAGTVTKVTVVTCGAPVAQDVLRTALAMGADAAVLVDTGAEPVDSLGVAHILKALVEREQASLVVCGKQAIDDDLGATGAMLAGLLDWPQAISVNKLELKEGRLGVTCDGDAGLEQWQLPVPAVISVDLRLCDPRSISLPNMMKAKKATITTIAAAELVSVPKPAATVVAVSEPPSRAAGKKVLNIDALIEEIRRLSPAVT